MERLRTVLVFAHECAPYHRPESTAGAQRPAQFAKHLPAFGWRAIVVCCDARTRGTGRVEALDAIADDARSRVREAGTHASVVVPTPSLPSYGLVDGMWRAAARRGRAGSVARKALTLAKFPHGDYSYPWQPVARAVARALAGEVPIDACVGEHSPDAGLFLAKWYSSEFGVPWIADFRDPILQPLTPFARSVYRPIARRLVSSAACTVNVSEAWVEMDRELFAKPAHTIPNGFDADEFADAQAMASSAFTIAYMGRVDAMQRMDLFLNGLRLARERVDGRFDVSFVYRGYGAETVARIAAEAGVGDLVDIGEHVERSHALGLMRSADLLLLLSIRNSDQYFARGFYPAKTFEYFGARRPILCVPGDSGVLDALLDTTRTGIVCETIEAVASCLVDAYGVWRARGVVPYDADADAVSRFTRRSQAGRLAAVLESIVAAS